MVSVTDTQNLHTVLTRNSAVVSSSWNSRSLSSITALCWSLAPVFSWSGIGPGLTRVVILLDYTIDQSFQIVHELAQNLPPQASGNALNADAMPIQWDEASCKFWKSTQYFSTISNAHKYLEEKRNTCSF